MSKFSIAARVAELRQANAALASKTLSSAEAEETMLQHFLRTWRSQSSVHAKSAPTAGVDAPSLEEKNGNAATHQASPYDLASSNPHIIAATLFTRKRW